MAVNLDACVSKAADDTWEVQCPITDGTCGTRPANPKDRVPFRSTGWPSKKVARARLDEHIAEHKGEGVMLPLDEFRSKHGLSVEADGSVITVKDL